MDPCSKILALSFVAVIGGMLFAIYRQDKPKPKRTSPRSKIIPF
jgi:hypothetical protein